jgi:hypothetical protein
MGAVDYTFTPDDLAEKLRQQVRFLRRSAAVFDGGDEDEALRLASIIRLLLHDTGASHSLLGQLGVKETFPYLDTSEPIEPNNLLPTMGLITARVDLQTRAGSYVAPLGHAVDPRADASPAKPAMYIRGAYHSTVPPGPPSAPPYSRQKPFAAWWKDPVTKDSQGEEFSRWDYVRGCANKEGGSHVDPALDAEWAALTRQNTLHFKVSAGGLTVVVAPASDTESIEFGNPALASVRQIAYELDETLKIHLSHLL